MSPTRIEFHAEHVRRVVMGTPTCPTCKGVRWVYDENFGDYWTCGACQGHGVLAE